jgi:hypothetical protein
MEMLDPTIFKKSECPEEILTKLAIVQKIPQSAKTFLQTSPNSILEKKNYLIYANFMQCLLDFDIGLVVIGANCSKV